jgi:prepilin-type N-terminal cleavage/methylation domain-containing protein
MATGPAGPGSTTQRSTRGFTLVEVVLVITITAIVALIPSQVMQESIKVYASVAPRLDAAYQARLATERLRRDVREMGNLNLISAMTSTALTFTDTSNRTVSYLLTGSDLTRNGDKIATGVNSLAFRYWQDDGTVATAARDIFLLEVDLTIQMRSEPYRIQSAIYPRDTYGSPLNDDATSATETEHSANHFHLKLLSVVDFDVVIESLELSGGLSPPSLIQVKLNKQFIWKDSGGFSLPTGLLTLNEGTASERTVSAYGSPDLLVKFTGSVPSGTHDFTLTLRFTDGSSALLTPSVTW